MAGIAHQLVGRGRDHHLEVEDGLHLADGLAAAVLADGGGQERRVVPHRVVLVLDRHGVDEECAQLHQVGLGQQRHVALDAVRDVLVERLEPDLRGDVLRERAVVGVVAVDVLTDVRLEQVQIHGRLLEIGILHRVGDTAAARVHARVETGDVEVARPVVVVPQDRVVVEAEAGDVESAAPQGKVRVVVGGQRVRDVRGHQAADRMRRRELVRHHRERCDTADVILHAVAPHGGMGRERAERDPLQELPARVAGRGALAVVADRRGQELATPFGKVNLATELCQIAADRVATEVLEVDQVAVAVALRAFNEFGERPAHGKRAEERALAPPFLEIGMPRRRSSYQPVDPRVGVLQTLLGMAGRQRLMRRNDGIDILQQMQHLHGDGARQGHLRARDIRWNDKFPALKVAVAFRRRDEAYRRVLSRGLVRAWATSA